MALITIFFREYIGDVVGTGDVMDVDEFSLYVFTDGVVSELDVSNGTCCSILAPLDTCHVVIENCYWFRY